MRRRFAYILMALYLCTATEAYQLLKIPLLAVHFVQHCEEDPNTTLVGFFKMHYSDEMVFDDDWQQDMQLPFKCCNAGCMSVSPSLRSEILSLSAPDPVEIYIAFTPILGIFYSNTPFNTIFQPPRQYA